MTTSKTTAVRTGGIQPQDIERSRRQLARAMGVGHFGLTLAGEIVDVVERMHGTISRVPLPWQQLRHDRALGLSGFIYRLIRQSFGHLDQGFSEASRALQQGEDVPDGSWLKFQAALNGVCGDKLAQQDSPLALNMQLNSRLPQASGQPQQHIIFVHGLCMSELGWQNPAHEAFCEQMQDTTGAHISYLRYNSGLHISHNGQMLAELLQKQLDANTQISLIGHSMGGLMIRSALHAAQQAGHDWPQRLRDAVFLGSPHHGAPLERIGNHANRLLKVSPYLKPFSRLGDLRSAGIRDLRHGNICEDDWRDLPHDDETSDRRQHNALPTGPRYLLLAASLSPSVPAQEWQARHDYLVPVSSALGLSRQLNKQLNAPQLERHVLAGCNHLELISQGRVYQHMAGSMQR